MKIGSDPEVFLINSQSEVVSAVGIIPGTKSRPFITDNGAIQVDNILAEFNSVPASSRMEFILNHKLIIDDLNSFIKPLGLDVSIMASHMASDSLLDSSEGSRIAGCEPDYCAWNVATHGTSTYLIPNIKAAYDKTNLRAAGGHLHISLGNDELSMEHRICFVKSLDVVLGLSSVLLDSDSSRRKVYGKAGSFRPKFTVHGDSYNGLEYRTLSNFWLKSEELMGLVWDGVAKVERELHYLTTYANQNKDNLIKAINKSNKKLAKPLLLEIGVTV